MPGIFASNMILASDNATVWGTAAPGDTVTVAVTRPADGLELRRTSTADPETGAWDLSLGAISASKNLAEVAIRSGEDGSRVVLSGVMFGRVLLCSGQSNMAITMDAFLSYTDRPGSPNVTQIKIESARYADRIRLFTVASAGRANPGPEDTTVKSAAAYAWGIPSAATLGGDRSYFSFECWATSQALADADPSGTPLGLVVSAMSGSMIQAWMPVRAMAACPDVRLTHPPAFGAQGQWFNGMIAPLLRLRPAAVVWHQGEENADDAVDYRCMFQSMITEWRRRFAAPELPFVFVQLQPCGIPPDQRYAQAQALGLPATGMASCYDLGDPDPRNPHGLCHSRYKPQCGARIALQLRRLLSSPSSPAGWAPNVTSGPVAEGCQLVPDSRSRSRVSIQVNVSFGVGMHWNGTTQCSTCCGTVAYPMRVLVSSGTWKYVNPGDVSFSPDGRSMLIQGRWAPGWGPFEPLEIRYAWEDFPQCAIYNSAGLPAPPFNLTIPPR